MNLVQADDGRSATESVALTASVGARGRAPRRWTMKLAETFGVLALFCVASSASAIVISGGPTDTPPGGGSCTLSGLPDQPATAVVTCTGLNLSAVRYLYFGMTNTSVDGNAMDSSGPTGTEIFGYAGQTSTSLTYTGTTSIYNSVISGYQSVNTQLTLGFESGKGTMVTDATTEALSNTNGAVHTLWQVVGVPGFSVTATVLGSYDGVTWTDATDYFNSVNTRNGTDQELDHVNVGFYYDTCGNGTREGAEQCDLGAANGTSGSCCDANCNFVTAGTVCRPSTGPCDPAESCTGSSGSCPADVNPTCTPSPTQTPTQTPTRTPTNTPTQTPTVTPTATPTQTPTQTPTNTPTQTPTLTNTPTNTLTLTPTLTQSPTLTPTETPTRTVRPTMSQTATPTTTPTDTPTVTATETVTDTPTETGTPTDTPTGTPTPTATAPLDNFQCYKVVAAKAPAGQTPFPKFTPRSGVVVVDAFSTSLPADQHKVDLKKAVDVCNPADVRGGDASAPGHAAHFEAYGITLSKTTPAQPKFTKSVQTIENTLGTLKLNVTGIASVMEPSAAALGTGGVASLGGTSLDHFKCYKVSVARAAARQTPYPKFTPTTVTMLDQLGGPRQLTVTKPTKLCLPADQNLEDPTAPTDPQHLVCYAVKLSRTTPAQAKFTPTPLSTNNEFGSEVLRATKLDELCVPSQRTN